MLPDRMRASDIRATWHRNPFSAESVATVLTDGKPHAWLPPGGAEQRPTTVATLLAGGVAVLCPRIAVATK